MYCIISSNASRKVIEDETGILYRFPSLYIPKLILNGYHESTLSIITDRNPNFITFAIWGMLPEGYQDDWHDFQKIWNTLKIHKDHLMYEDFYKDSFNQRRCLIITTGFFVYHFSKNTVYPYYVYLRNFKPFYLAGIYNILSDGFITCTLITKKSTGIVKKIQNLNSEMPIPLSKEQYKYWISPDFGGLALIKLIDQPNYLSFNAHPIAKDLFHQDIIYDSMLEPVYYNGIPIFTDTVR